MKYNIFIFSFLILIISCNCVSATWWEDNYDYRKKIILIGPETFSKTYTSFEDGHIYTNSYTRQNTYNYIHLENTSTNGLYRGYIEWNISTIPNDANITNIIFKYSSLNRGGDGDAHISAMNYRPSSSSSQNVWNDSGDGTIYANVDGFPVIGNNQEINLGNDAITDLEAALVTNWFAIGFCLDDETLLNSNYSRIYSMESTSANPKPTLYVEYSSESEPSTNYQLLLNITYDSDMQSDFDDLRFCNETHELDSWLESKVDDSYALVWVEFPTTPANGVNQTYYMYYGNAGAASDWDIGATFLFGDGFDSLTAWSTVSGIPAVSGGELTLNSGDGVYRDVTFPSLYCIHGRIKDANNGTDSTRFSLSITNSYTTFGPNIGWRTSGGIYEYSGGWALFGSYASNVYNIIEMRNVNSIAHTWDAVVDNVVGITDAGFYNSVTPSRIILTANAVNCYADWIFARKYVANPPTYVFGSEETESYMPPNPISLMNTTGNFWINHTWSPGSSNVTNSYNISVNDVWHNTSPAYYNDTYAPHAWQNITVYAFNTSGAGTLSTGSINQNTQIPNNPITITNTSDWTGDAGEVVYVDYDATDIDSDTATFSCDRTDLFTDFDTSTGIGNWTATANIYYVDFGVSDGYGSISNYTMTLIESSVETTLTDEIKLITSEIITGLKSINMGNYLVYAFILIGILLIILGIQIITNNIYRG